MMQDFWWAIGPSQADATAWLMLGALGVLVMLVMLIIHGVDAARGSTSDRLAYAGLILWIAGVIVCGVLFPDAL